MFVWYDRYNVGHPQIDADHRYLFGLIAAFHAAVVDGSGDERAGDTLDALSAYTRDHFAREELEMLACSYPDYADHKASHAQLIEALDALAQRFRDGDPMVGLELSQFLADWVIQHTMTVDAKLAAFLMA